jgi:integrase
MVATLIFSGLRREELLWLTPEDLDFTAGTYGLIRVRAKTLDGESWQPKTKRNRAVPISSRLRLFLDKWRLKRTGSTWFFPSPDGKRWDPDKSDVRTANENLKLPWGCLDFRHTFGSQLAMEGESLYQISAIMGNSPEICRRRYAALLTKAPVDSVEFPEAKAAGLAAIVMSAI